MLISHTPVRGVILKYFGENHTLCVKFEPNWTRCKQLEEGIKSLACGSWFYPFLSLFANSFNLERYSSRGGQEKPLGWRLGVFLDHHEMNIAPNWKSLFGGSSAVDIVLAVRWSLKWIYFAVRWSIIGNGLTVRWSLLWQAQFSVDRSSETVWRSDDRSSETFWRGDDRSYERQTGLFFRWSINGKKCRSEERSSPRQTVSDDRSSEREINSFERSSERQNDVDSRAFPDWRGKSEPWLNNLCWLMPVLNEAK